MNKISVLAGISFLLFTVLVIGSVAATEYPLLSVKPSGTVWTLNFDNEDITADDVDVSTLVLKCYLTGGGETIVTPLKVLSIKGQLVLIIKATSLPTGEVDTTSVTGQTLTGDDIIAAGGGFAWGRR